MLDIVLITEYQSLDSTTRPIEYCYTGNTTGVDDMFVSYKEIFETWATLKTPRDIWGGGDSLTKLISTMVL